MDIPKEVLAAAIGAMPALLALFVPWALDHRGSSQRLKHATELEKRVQVIEKVLALDNALPDDSREMLRAELTEIAQDLVANRVQERTAGETSVERLGRLPRWLLLYPQPSLRAHMYRVLYWFFLAVVLAGVLAGSLGVLLGGTRAAESVGLAIGLMFYLLIALLFRAAALRQQKRAQAMAARSVKK